MKVGWVGGCGVVWVSQWWLVSEWKIMGWNNGMEEGGRRRTNMDGVRRQGQPPPATPSDGGWRRRLQGTFVSS